jgi:hypothetical protein
MKKTIIALMALSGVASADTTWSFEGDLSTTGYTINTSATEVYSYKVKEQVTEGDTTVEKEVTKYGRRAATLTYVDSGLTKGTVIGNYTLDVNKGKAVDLTKVTTGGTKWISLNSTYYTNGDGKLYAGDSGTDFTLMAYVKFDNISGEQFIFGTGSSNEVGLAFGLRDGQLDLLTKYVAHNSIESDNPVTLKADEWYHVAASYNAKNKDVTFYVNGDSIGTVTIDKVNNKYFNVSITYVKDHKIAFAIYKDVTQEVLNDEKIKQLRQEMISVTDKVINKQMAAVQEIASLLGESTAEAKIALINFKNSLKDGWKPFFIFVFLFQAIYSILAILGYLIWIIVSRLRMNKRFGKTKIKDGEENHGEEI